MHNPFPCKNEKKYQKSFHFHLTHQYLPLIMSKRISKKIIKSRWVGHKKVFKGSAWCICFIFSWPKKVVEVHSKNLSFQRLWRNQLLKLPNEGILSNIGIFKVCILKKKFGANKQEGHCLIMMLADMDRMLNEVTFMSWKIFKTCRECSVCLQIIVFTLLSFSISL